MNKDWAQYWIGLFADRTDELMTLYSPKFQFEDVNFGLSINEDLPALRRFFENFIIEDQTQSYNKFDVFDYVGDARLGSFQWTWETKHAGEFLERSIWDAIRVFQQLGVIPTPEIAS